MDPGSTGIGGDVFVLFYDAETKKVKGLNARYRIYIYYTFRCVRLQFDCAGLLDFEKKWMLRRTVLYCVHSFIHSFIHFLISIYSGRSSANMSLDYLKAKGISRNQGHIRIPLNSADSVNVPGAAAGWVDTVEMFGSGRVSE